MEQQQAQTVLSPAQRIVPSFQFLQEVEHVSHQPVSLCYQCKKCSGGCPVGFSMEIVPNQIVRSVQLGLKEVLLKSQAIWVCTGCKTCKSRCPNGIDISAVNDALKELAVQAGVPAGDRNIQSFHQSFLNSVEKHGRVHELGMMVNYKMKTGTYTKDAHLGVQMLKKGILKIWAEGIRQKREIKAIFRQARGKD